MKAKKQTDERHNEENEEAAKSLDEQLQNEPSKVGKMITELTIRRVILIILSMIMIFPFLDEPEKVSPPERLHDRPC